MSHLLQHRRLTRQGYVLLVALILMAIIGVIGATSLSVAGVDHRVAAHNRKHMVVFNTSTAGTEHARNKLETEDPKSENVDSVPDSFGTFVNMTAAETNFGGTYFDQNLGVYWVEAVYERCANPPPGYSTEQGRNAFRSDFWSMESTSRMAENPTTGVFINETQATTIATIRKVVFGACKVR